MSGIVHVRVHEACCGSPAAGRAATTAMVLVLTATSSGGCVTQLVVCRFYKPRAQSVCEHITLCLLS